MKEKGNMYKSPINKEINNSQKVYSTLYENDTKINNQSNLTNNYVKKNIIDYRSVDRKIYDILHSNDYIYSFLTSYEHFGDGVKIGFSGKKGQALEK